MIHSYYLLCPKHTPVHWWVHCLNGWCLPSTLGGISWLQDTLRSEGHRCLLSGACGFCRLLAYKVSYIALGSSCWFCLKLSGGKVRAGGFDSGRVREGSPRAGAAPLPWSKAPSSVLAFCY